MLKPYQKIAANNMFKVKPGPTNEDAMVVWMGAVEDLVDYYLLNDREFDHKDFKQICHQGRE